MNRFLVTLLGAFLVVGLVGGGCSSDDKSDKKSGDAMKAASEDMCTHCAGVQKANADGKCPKCNAMLMSSSGASGAATPAAADIDACTHCPGVQTASATGTCPACGAAVAKK